MRNERLSENFWLSEFTKSQTARRYGISNQPYEHHIKALKLLCEKVLQPLRNHYKRPVIISSGYRSTEVNRLVRGSPTSQHKRGEAADFEIPSVDNYTVAKWMETYLNYDQLILEYYTGGNSGWIHCSYRANFRNQELTINHSGTFNGLRRY